MNQTPFGHIRMENDVPIYQTLKDHCQKTSVYAENALQKVNLGKTGKLAGLAHDIGKASPLFQTYLYDAVVSGKKVKKGSVNHTSAGCCFFLKRYHDDDYIDANAIAAEIVAYACGAHHGLFDCMDTKSGFSQRCAMDKPEFKTEITEYLQQQEAEITALFIQAKNEISGVIDKILEICEGRTDDEADFYFGLLTRLILSAVMEGDRRDTAEFMSCRKYANDYCEESRAKMWQDAVLFMENKLNRLGSNTDINLARKRISDISALYADKTAGIVRLNVPTGAGKTLTSLRYALRYAKNHNKSRIIFTSSLLSVLDQNAQVIRDYLPNQKMILEHHSNVVHPKQTNEKEEWEMMVEAWRSPVIITTLVQLLNTLFLGKTSNIRRFHALSNAVLVIDEVQSVPNNLLTLFNLAVNFLSEICNTTVVLCSATQPCLEKADHPLLYTPEDIVPFDNNLWKPFQRTLIQNIGNRQIEEIPQMAFRILQEKTSLLVVCNLKKEAKQLYEMCKVWNGSVFHLSAGMCMQHRRNTLEQLQAALTRKEKVLCISTQVIEAGVDISFECVIRFLAGMDSIVQSAGRCNRNGESSLPASVFVVECDNEQLGRLQTIRDGKTASASLLEAYSRSPGAFDNSLTSDASIRYYFKKLYGQMNKGFQDDYISEIDKTLFNLLSSNLSGNPQEEKYAMHQAFKTAGEYFSVFNTDTTDVIVGYGDGKILRNRLIAQSESYTPDFELIHNLIEQAKPYAVSLYRYQVEQLEQKNAIVSLFDGRVSILSDGFYDDSIGFTMDKQFWEV